MIARRADDPKLSERQKRPTAKERSVLDREPPLDLQMTVAISAWQTLDSCRPLGLRPMPVKCAAPVLVPFRGEIPWTAIEQYGRFHGLGPEAVVLLAEVIGRLDNDRAKRDNDEFQRKAPR
jgi:hypothetical protein